MDAFNFGPVKTGPTRKTNVTVPLPSLISQVIDPNFIMNVVDVPMSRQQLQKDQKIGKRAVVDQPESTIVENKMFILSYAEMIELSVAQINNVNNDGPNSLHDPRMGTYEYSKPCATCGLDNSTCVGHAGHIDFNDPVMSHAKSEESSLKIYNPLYIEEIIKVLRSVCNDCSRLLLTESQLTALGLLRSSGALRLALISAESEKKSCSRGDYSDEEILVMYPGMVNSGETVTQMLSRQGISRRRTCQPNPIFLAGKVKEINAIQFKISDMKGETSHPFSIDKAYNIMRFIPDTDLKLLFGQVVRPVNMIMQALIVIPPNHRPPRLVNGNYDLDPISKQYQDIITTVNDIHNKSKSDEQLRKKDNLFQQIKHLMQNVNKAKRSANGYKSIIEQIQGKEGFMRGELMGTRGNFVARTIIGPNPSLRYGQISVPRDVTWALIRQEIVAAFNKDYLTKLMKDGKVTAVVHGPRRDTRGNRTILQRYIPGTVEDNSKGRVFELKIGDIVERHLKDGDMVVANRQPTLHKASMRAYEAVIWDNKNIGLHSADTTGFNADHDGDEMNLYTLMGVESAAEALELMSFRNCLMTASSNQNIVGLILNSVTGSYLLTDPNLMVDVNLFWSCFMLLDEDTKATLTDFQRRCDQYGLDRFSGRALFSLLLPPDFSYEKDSDSSGPVIIVDGILISGRVTKDHVGALVHQSIPQVLFKVYGPDRVIKFITEASWVLNEWMTERGFTVGVDDCILPDKVKVAKIVSEELGKTEDKISALGGKRANPLEELDREIRTINELKSVAAIGVRFRKEVMEKDNAIGSMISAKAKGNDYNITQSIALIGQQLFKGERIPKTLTGGRRCLPHFDIDSEEIDGQGFCRNSFWTGLSPTELFFHMAAGREGLMDTANNTSRSGDIHHRMTKALENLTVNEDRSVRNKSGVILQQIYGYDGFDAAKMINVSSVTGKYASFIDIKNIANKINSSYGWIPARYLEKK